MEAPPQFRLVDAAVGEPREHGRALPAVPVDARLDAVGKHARQVAEDAAACDVCERANVGAPAELADVLQIQAMRLEQELGVDLVVAEQLAHEREAVRVQPTRWHPDDDVARLAARAVDDAVAIDDADASAGKVELIRSVDARELRGLAADQRAARFPAD